MCTTGLLTNNFFERQDQAKRITQRLLFAYLGCVLLIFFAFHAVFTTALMFLDDSVHYLDQTVWLETFLNPTLCLYSLSTVGAILLFATLYKTILLSKGGSVVAESLGGVEVAMNTTDLAEQRYLHIVEEMALAAGIPCPRVFVLPNESTINAFAAGHRPEDAAVAVTRGALDLLTRDELQGIIGHEFSHILNGDMRLNIRLMAILFGILCIALFGQLIFRLGGQLLRFSPVRSRKSKKGNSTAQLALLLIVFGAFVWLIGMIGVFCSRILQAMVSRQRENLADAASVQFTRNPQGLTSALRIVRAENARGLRNPNAHASEASHLFFVSALHRPLFATHPPLLKRIRALDPNYQSDDPEAIAELANRKAELL